MDGNPFGNVPPPPIQEWGQKGEREWGHKGGPPRKGGQAHIANRQGEGSVQLNHEEIERVRFLLSKLEKPTSTCSLTYSSKFLVSFGFNVSDTPFTH